MFQKCMNFLSLRRSFLRWRKFLCVLVSEMTLSKFMPHGKLLAFPFSVFRERRDDDGSVDEYKTFLLLTPYTP